MGRPQGDLLPRPYEASGAWRLAKEKTIRVGTASWTDKTLLEAGLFYPPEAKTPAQRLRFYGGVFPIVEVDASYYALPAERNTKAWLERTSPDFVFNVKAFALLTRHPTAVRSLPPDVRAELPPEEAEKKNVYVDRMPGPLVDEIWTRFCAALLPLSRAGRLTAVLFQFPEWFPPGRAHRDYVVECSQRLSAGLPGTACAVELRNEAWMRDERSQERTLGFLSEHRLPYVCVDMPQGFRSSIPPVAAVTAPPAMVRFHGRRSETWDRRGVSVTERFRYDYSAAELEEWVPKVREMAGRAGETHVLMNNCYRDYAVRSARTMAQLLLEGTS